VNLELLGIKEEVVFFLVIEANLKALLANVAEAL
jgi:hypothetical protein